MKCINCSYFLNCDCAEEDKRECDKYKKRRLGELKDVDSKSR